MEKRIRITESDLGYIINEVCRKLSLLNESVKEGGAYGHMSHPYEINEYTFGDFKQLVVDLFRTGIEHASEKLDGMNIFATVTPDGQVSFARNSTQVKGNDTGMGVPEMEERWGGGKDQSTLIAYKNAYYLFSDAVKKLPDPIGFFNGDGYKLFANCEVIDPRHPNVIPYNEIAFSIHGLVALTNDGEGKPIEIPDEEEQWRMDMLERVLPTVNSEYGKIQTTPEVVIKIRENGEAMIERFTAQIDSLESLAGLSDEGTVADFKRKMIIGNLINSQYKPLLDQPFTELILNRWTYSDKEKKEKPVDMQNLPTKAQIRKMIRTSGVENAEELAILFLSFDDQITEVFKEFMRPLQNFFYRLGNEVIKGVQGYSNEGRENEVVQSLVSQLETAKELVATYGTLEQQNEFAYWLERFSEMDNEYNAMEGVVFNYKGKTLKLTGSFASLNRAINLRFKFQDR